MTVTGHRVDGAPTAVFDRAEALAALHLAEFPPRPPREGAAGTSVSMEDEQVLILCRAARNSEKFALLWAGDTSAYSGDDSRADAALVSMLAFYTQDEGQLDRLFRASGLMRDKWERSDYGARTVRHALDHLTETYTPPKDALLHQQEDRLLEIIPEVTTGSAGADVTSNNTDVTSNGQADDFVTIAAKTAAKAAEAVADVTTGARNHRKAYSLTELEEMPDPIWLIKDHVTAGAFGCLYGVSGAAKSFIALDMGLCVANGLDFLGKFPVRQAPVLYVCSEGGRGIKKRVRAWMEHNGVGQEGPIRFIPAPFDLTEGGEADLVLELGCKGLRAVPGLIVVDTLSRNMSSSDRDEKAMMSYVRNIDFMIRKSGAAVVSIHHSGWLVGRERGVTQLRDSCDVMIHSLPENTENVTKNERAFISCTKQKDDEPFEDYTLRKERVQTKYGASCVWTWEGQADEIKAQAQKARAAETTFANQQEFKSYLNVGQANAISSTEHMQLLKWGKSKYYDVFDSLKPGGSLRYEVGGGKKPTRLWLEA